MAPAKKPETPEKKSVIIGDVAYYMDSDNAALLKKMPPVTVSKQDPKTKKRVKIEVEYEYIPISIIHSLLGGLTDTYDMIDHGAKYVEEYNVVKEVNGQKKEDTVRAYEYAIEYRITVDGVVRVLRGYCRGVASVNILRNDGSANGFFQKLGARATKSALKRLGRVFRMNDEADDIIDDFSPETPVVAEEKPYTPKEEKVVAKEEKSVEKKAVEPVAKAEAPVAKAEVVAPIEEVKVVEATAPAKPDKNAQVIEELEAIAGESDKDQFDRWEKTFIEALTPLIESNKPDGTPYESLDINAAAKELIRKYKFERGTIAAKALSSAVTIAKQALESARADI